jgi:hypothetical protein
MVMSMEDDGWDRLRIDRTRGILVWMDEEIRPRKEEGP